MKFVGVLKFGFEIICNNFNAKKMVLGQIGAHGIAVALAVGLV